MSAKRWGSPAQRRRRRCVLFQQVGGICPYCHKPMAWDEFTIDHKIPRSLGGSNRFENLIGCCLRCNQVKSNHYPNRRLFVRCEEPGCYCALR